MLEYRVGQHTHNIGEDYFETYKPTKYMLDKALCIYTQVPNFRELVHDRAADLRIKGFRMLRAHGYTYEDGDWVFSDGEDVCHAVQNWVDVYDGSALVLMIMSCNPDGLEVVSNKSVVIHPSKKTNLLEVAQNPNTLRVRSPNFGYIR